MDSYPVEKLYPLDKQTRLSRLLIYIIPPFPKRSFLLKNSSENMLPLTVSFNTFIPLISVPTSDTVAHPMRFITGRGNRSVGGKGVLGPAVYNALIEDGWNVSKFAGGLTIRGRIGS